MQTVVFRLLMMLASKNGRRGCLAILAGIVASVFVIGIVFANISLFLFDYYLVGDFYYPMPDHTYVSSPFDPNRRHPTRDVIEPHNGTDYSAPEGTEVFSCRAGTVNRVWYNSEEGNAIEIRHGDNVITRYKHLYKTLVEAGDEVASRDLIGLCGATGVVTGPHVHLEIKVGGSYVDPAPLMKPWPAEGESEIFDTSTI